MIVQLQLMLQWCCHTGPVYTMFLGQILKFCCVLAVRICENGICISQRHKNSSRLCLHADGKNPNILKTGVCTKVAVNCNVRRSVSMHSSSQNHANATYWPGMCTTLFLVFPAWKLLSDRWHLQLFQNSS